MGQWFSNISVRKTDGVTVEVVREYLRDAFCAKGFVPVDDGAPADCGIAIIAPAGSHWITFASDFISLDSPETSAEILGATSAALDTDALGVACFDSDYVFMNIVNAHEKLDGWVNIGFHSGYGIKRRTSFGPWKGKVSDFGRFKAAARTKSVFAEDALYRVAEYLELPGDQVESEYSTENADAYLYFRLPEGAGQNEPPKLRTCINSSRDMAIIEKRSHISFINIGGASRGLTIYFAGSFVEHDELTFDAQLMRRSSYYSGYWAEENIIPLELRKQQLANGSWLYAATVNDYHIREREPEGLGEARAYAERAKREITLHFSPHGKGINQPKAMDLCVIAVPIKNPAGYAVWNVWDIYLTGEKLVARKEQLAEILKALAPPLDADKTAQ